MQNSANTSNQTNAFTQALESSGEVGFVEQVFSSLVFVSGLPGVKQNECVIFENGQMGQILSLRPEYAEVLLFSTGSFQVGMKVTRLGMPLKIPVGIELLGQVIDSTGKSLSKQKMAALHTESRVIDTAPSGMSNRTAISLPQETGCSIVDLLVPLGRGQRELVIGDRKTGKSSFLLGVLHNQATSGTICIYALIGKRNIDVKKVIEFCEEKKIMSQTVIVASTATDSAGVIFLTPYTAMTIAEYFRDQGKHVLLILDDMTTHAQYYREITLLAKRFPGRSSYPGDIFYVQAKLLERAGSYTNATITCLPVGESLQGDLSGYIQTNIMAITDGHVFFDTDVFNQGRRPAINPYLSVTRVGEQAQTPLLRDLSRQLSRFLVHYQRLRELVHFGSEFEDRVRKDMALGERIFAFFNQAFDFLVPLNMSILIIGALWSGSWGESPEELIRNDVAKLIEQYKTNPAFKQKCDRVVKSSKSFQSLVVTMREQPDLLKI